MTLEQDVELDMPSIHALCFAEQLARAAEWALRLDELDDDDEDGAWWDS